MARSPERRTTRGMEVSDGMDMGSKSPCSLPSEAKNGSSLVALMLGRVKSFDILNPCPSHHLPPTPEYS